MARMLKHLMCVFHMSLAAFVILSIAVPYIVVAEEGEGESIGLSAPVPDNSSSTGAAVYKVPIGTPPGRLGIAPNIALTYDSYNRNGWVGVGWSLDMGSIQRATKKGINFSADDYVFFINGSSSELVRREDWGGDYYGAKIEGAFQKFYHDTASDLWIAITKDGTRYYYGYAELSKQRSGVNIFKWCLDRVQDTSGNYMEISYTGSVEKYPEEIKYTGNASGLLPMNSVKFIMELRTDNPSDKASASIVYRLKNIEVYADSQPVSKYELSYDYSPGTHRSLLTSITRYGSDGSPMPPITFTYTEMYNGFSETPLSWNTPKPEETWPVYVRGTDKAGNHQPAADYDGDGNNDTVNYLEIVDMDGDGLPDRVTAAGDGDKNYLWVYLNNLSRCEEEQIPCGFDETPILWSTPVTKNSWPQSPQLSNSKGVYQALIDMNADGLPDKVAKTPDGDGDLLVYLNTYKSNGTYSFGEAISWNTPQVNGWDRYVRSFDVYGIFQDITDMNGDGLPDRVTAISKLAGESYLYVYLNNGNGFDNEAIEWATTAMNGNWRQYPQTGNVYQGIIDMNGDGLPDRVANLADINNLPIDGDLSVFLNNGNGFNSAPLGWTTPRILDFIRYVKFGAALEIIDDIIDINGDGLPDRVSGNRTCINPETCDRTYFFVHPNTGSSFSTTPIYWEIPVINTAWFPVSQTATAGGVTQALIDMNGDGLPDRVTNSPGADGNLQVYLSPGPFPDLLHTIDNGIGGRATISYAPSTQYTNISLPFVVQTVSSMTADDGNGNVSTTYYTYSGGDYNHIDREFKGFAYAKRTNPDNTTVETLFHQDDNRKGLPSSQIVKDAGGSIYARTSNSYMTKAEDPDNCPADNMPCLIQKDDYLYDGTSSFKHTASSFTYDTYGNITRKYDHGEVNDASPDTPTGDERTECISYYNDAGADAAWISKWTVSLPKSNRIFDGVHDCNESGTPGAKTTFEYYADTGRLHKRHNWHKRIEPPAEETILTTIYDYDAYGNLESVTDPLGYGASTTYDTTTNTFPETVTNHLEHTSSATYDYRFGKPLKRTDPNGNETKYEYDVFGRPTKVTNPYDSSSYYGTVSTFYNDNDLGTVGAQRITTYVTEQSSTSDALWKETYFDGFGRTIKTKSEGPDGKIIVAETQYNNLGQVYRTSMPYFTDSSGNQLESPRWTYFTYDPVGRVIRVDNPYDTSENNPDGTHVTKSYLKGTSTFIDTMGRKKVEEKDAYGRLVRAEQYTGTYSSAALYAATTYEYNILNNLVKVIAPKVATENNETIITYDTLGRKTSITDPDMGYWTYTYDANGNLKTQTDAKGQTITFYYDQLNRITKKDYPAGTDVIYTYDVYDDGTSVNAKGRLTKVTDASGTSQFYYDKLGRTTKTVKTIGGDSYTIETGYDALGRTTSIKYPDGTTVPYTYDSGGNLSTVTGYASYPSYPGFNALGQPGKIIYANGVYTDYGYYPTNNRLKTIKTNNGGLQDLTYDYDNAGNIKKITSGIADGFIQADPLSETYAYTSAKPHAVTQTVTQAGSKTFDYDDNGNMKDRAGQAITYDYDNMPDSIGGNITFVYDYSGQRVKKITPTSTTVYIGGLYECTVNVCSKHIYAGGQRIATVLSNSTVYYYHTDHLGSSTLITNSDGAVVQSVKYYGFGATRYQDPLGNILDYKYTGQEEDPETGLYYYGARYYDPALGMFITADSIVQDPSDSQTLNRYAYAGNNPMIYTDPSGHFFGFLIGAVIGAVIGGFQSDWDAGAMLTGAIIGGVSGGIYSGTYSAAVGVIGSSTNATLTGVLAGTVGGMAAGATANALGSAIYGGDMGLRGAALGAVGGAVFGAIGGYFGNTWNMYRVGAYGLAGGGVSELGGGNFSEGAILAGSAAFGRFMYNEIVGFDADWNPGGEAQAKDRLTMPYKGVNNIGVQGGPVDPEGLFNEGGSVSRGANYIPGVNATGGMHDVFQVKLDEFFGGKALGSFMRSTLNVPAMLPAAALSYGALMADPRTMILYSIGSRRK